MSETITESRIPTRLIRTFQQDAPVDLDGLASALGVKVQGTTDLPEGISGKIFPDRENGGTADYCIQINMGDPFARRRFTLAHELAHFILHRDLIGTGITDNELYRSGLPDQREFEANRLAADILMPSHLIFRYRDNGVRSVEALAARFKVSAAAMRIRMQELLLG